MNDRPKYLNDGDENPDTIDVPEGAATITVSLRIENNYGGADIVTTATDKVIESPANFEGGDENRDWQHTYIYDFTGTGRTEGDSWYVVEVTASSDPALLPVGATFEFGF